MITGHYGLKVHQTAGDEMYSFEGQSMCNMDFIKLRNMNVTKSQQTDICYKFTPALLHHKSTKLWWKSRTAVGRLQILGGSIVGEKICLFWISF